MINTGSLKNKAVIFDLDGTLIDSELSILFGLEFAIRDAGLKPAIPITKSLIGPPLQETLEKLLGVNNAIDVHPIMEGFKAYYDNQGFKKTTAYPGIVILLKDLKNLGMNIYLATNKRFSPTKKIIKYLGWELFFSDIYAIDKFPDLPYNNKTHMICELIKKESLEATGSVYVGDRVEDFMASAENGLSTILVEWGYGDLENNPKLDGVNYASTPKVLFQMIRDYK